MKIVLSLIFSMFFIATTSYGVPSKVSTIESSYISNLTEMVSFGNPPILNHFHDCGHPGCTTSLESYCPECRMCNNRGDGF